MARVTGVGAGDLDGFLGAEADGQPPPGFSCLVPLAPGPAETAGPALFLVHPVGGNVLCYRELAQLLGGERPVYGLQSQGLGDGLAPEETVAAMAATYLTSVRRVVERGPYHLAGWSIGGVIAYEMAQQLAAAGEEVSLVLLDSTAPGAGPGSRKEPDEAVLLLGLARDLSGLAGREPAVSLELLRELGPEAGLEEVLERLIQAGALPPTVGREQAARLWRVYRSNVRAASAYEPRVYAGPLALLAASGNPLLPSLGSALGWERLAGAEIATQSVAADHYSLLREPAVRLVADALRKYGWHGPPFTAGLGSPPLSAPGREILEQ
jgi:thioesterase domain-containing protein